MKHKILWVIFIIFIFSPQAFAATSASQLVSARLIGGGGGGGGGDTPTGGIIAGGAVGGAAAGASTFAFAPLLLAGLEPNPVICAAAPLESICPRMCYLEEAIKCQGGIKLGAGALTKVENKYYLAQNDCTIINGTYDVDEIILPKELQSADKIKVKITIASQGYKEVDDDPELVIGIYKDIERVNLNKKFETQQFLRHYMMKKYEIPLEITSKEYNQGFQKLLGTIDLRKIENINQPLKIVVRYTEGGFRKNLKNSNPKVLTYAYLIEFDKIR